MTFDAAPSRTAQIRARIKRMARVNAHKLRHELDVRGMSLTVLADRLEVPPSTVSRWLSGRGISHNNLARLAGLLDRTPVVDGVSDLLEEVA